jgi:hypothetical protein
MAVVGAAKAQQMSGVNRAASRSQRAGLKGACTQGSAGTSTTAAQAPDAEAQSTASAQAMRGAVRCGAGVPQK